MEFFFIISALAGLLLGAQQTLTAQQEYQQQQIEEMINNIKQQADNDNADAQYYTSEAQNYQEQASDTNGLEFIGGQAIQDNEKAEEYKAKAKHFKQLSKQETEKANQLSEQNNSDEDSGPCDTISSATQSLTNQANESASVQHSETEHPMFAAIITDDNGNSIKLKRGEQHKWLKNTLKNLLRKNLNMKKENLTIKDFKTKDMEKMKNIENTKHSMINIKK